MPVTPEILTQIDLGSLQGLITFLSIAAPVVGITILGFKEPVIDAKLEEDPGSYIDREIEVSDDGMEVTIPTGATAFITRADGKVVKVNDIRSRANRARGGSKGGLTAWVGRIKRGRVNGPKLDLQPGESRDGWHGMDIQHVDDRAELATEATSKTKSTSRGRRRDRTGSGRSRGRW